MDQMAKDTSEKLDIWETSCHQSVSRDQLTEVSYNRLSL